MDQIYPLNIQMEMRVMDLMNVYVNRLRTKWFYCFIMYIRTEFIEKLPEKC